MSRATYAPGPAAGAEVHKTGDKNWTLVVVRELKHPPEKVWEAITDPAHLREWSPFDSDANLATATTAKLTTVGAPQPHVTEAKVKRAEAPKLLEYNWGDFDMKWELAPIANGTRLTLWTTIGRKFVAMGAAGWHVCFDVLDRMLAGEPIGRIVGPDALKLEGWTRLNTEYSNQFGVEPISW